MGHLKRASSGHLLKSAGGHLVNSCYALEEACGCCFSSNARASFTMPALNVATTSGRNAYQQYTDSAFVGWFNTNVTSILTDVFDALGTAWHKTGVGVGNTFGGQDATTGESVTVTVGVGDIDVYCTLDGEARYWNLDMDFQATAGEGGDPNGYQISFTMQWADGTCCGASGGYDTFTAYSFNPEPGVASGGAAISIVDNYACWNGTSCESTAEDNCPDYAACSELP